MSSKHHKKFIAQSKGKAFDLNHRKTIKFNMSKYRAAVERGRLRYSDIESAKHKIASVKRDVLLNWDKYLLQFEEEFTANGGEVIWAENEHEALEKVFSVLKQEGVDMLVKSKSMTTEEIEFNEYAESCGIEPVETDLGEYIVQLAGEKPYHIVTPAMHKSKQDIGKLFYEKFGFPADSSAEEMTALARKNLREKFMSAGAGITGANFIVADAGGIAVTENEGNALMSTSFPRIHIAIVGIEKIIPKMDDLADFWPVLSAHGTGQAVTVYNSLFTGPKKDDEDTGPEKMYVVLLDNGRSGLYQLPEHKKSLSCIRCGACLNACPIYHNVGGYTYDTVYSGPIGSVITPHLRDFAEYKHLSFACTLCGRCSEVCPQKIPLADLMLLNRKMAVEKGLAPWGERFGMFGFKELMIDHKRLDLVGGGVKNIFMDLFGANLWGDKRDLPKVSKKSFRKQWSSRNDNN